MQPASQEHEVDVSDDIDDNDGADAAPDGAVGAHDQGLQRNALSASVYAEKLVIHDNCTSKLERSAKQAKSAPSMDRIRPVLIIK